MRIIRIRRSMLGGLGAALAVTTMSALALGDTHIQYPRSMSPAESGFAVAEEVAPQPESLSAISSPDTAPELVPSEVIRERYADGKIKIEREVALDSHKNYVNHGVYREYDPRGNKMAEGQYRHGKMNGRWVRSFTDGRGQLFSGDIEKSFTGPFVSVATFVDNQLDGEWIIASLKTQRKVIEWHFAKGVRHGTATWFYPNGEKRAEVEYKNGQPDGDYLEWGPDKRLTRTLKYIDGRLLSTQTKWYSAGKKQYEGTYLMGLRPQPTFDWWTGSTELLSTEKLGPDQKQGVWTAWYPNGQEKVRGQYKQDLPVGTFTWWYENGQKQAEGQYDGGVQEGPWVTWHRNGMRESEANYQSGVLVGKMLAWQSDGKLAEIQDFTSTPEVEAPTELAAEPESIEAAQVPKLVPADSEQSTDAASTGSPSKLR